MNFSDVNFKEIFFKIILSLGILLVSLYLFFRIQLINFSWFLLPFSVLLFIAELHAIILIYGMFYSIWPRKYKEYKIPNTRRDLEINMFITVAGEPTEIVKETILCAKKAAEYYQRTIHPYRSACVIVLNDGKAAKKENWQEIADFCQEVGVKHIARESNEGFKAGNINNGIKQFPSSDPNNTIDCFFDADFSAKEYFLNEILKPLIDPSIDFVQSPQRYKNLNTWVAKAAGAHQIFFFDYICPAKSYDNALFLCGTNYAIRRKALLEAGGVDKRFVTEDYATSIKLHLQGKKGVLLKKVLAVGLAPMNLKEYFNQQTRWCKGCLDANRAYFKELFFGSLTLKQKFHYFLSTAYYFIGVRDLILILAPVPYLFFGISLIRANTIEFLAMVYLPLIIYNFTLFFMTFRFPIKSLVLDLVAFPVFANAFLSCIIKRNLPFTITIKKYNRENPFKVYKIQLVIASILVVGLIYSFISENHNNIYGRAVNYFWASYDAIFLITGFWLVVKENYDLSFINKAFNSFKVLGRVSFQPTYSIKILAIFMVLIFSTSSIKAFALARTNFQDMRPELLVPDNGIYYGYYSPSLNSHPKNFSLNIVDSEKPSLAMFYQDWGDNGFDTEFIRRISEKNVVPVITWEPWNFEPKKYSIGRVDYSPKNIIDGKYDDYIRNWAIGAAKFKKPIFLRFAQEMNGNWYGWGNVEGNTPDDYKKMWIHVFGIFKTAHADNVIWVWSPNNTDEYGNTDSILSYYPGDKYVDWVGFSGFNWGNSLYGEWMPFKYIVADVYNQLAKLNKPIMVAETSSVGHGESKAFWYKQTIMHDIPSYPKIKAVIFWNAEFKNSDFSISGDSHTKEVIREDILGNGYYLKEPQYNIVI